MGAVNTSSPVGNRFGGCPSDNAGSARRDSVAACQDEPDHIAIAEGRGLSQGQLLSKCHNEIAECIRFTPTRELQRIKPGRHMRVSLYGVEGIFGSA